MPKTGKLNLARIVYDAYPHSDLLPLDPEKDCRDLQALMEKVRGTEIGDTLFQFLVLEIVEGGEGTLEGTIRVIERARGDVDAVLQALKRARCARPGEPQKPRRPDRRSDRAHLRIWRCRDCRRCLYRSYRSLAGAGAPFCPGCGREMRLT
ncbi:MAG TPA: hypothetical protein VNA25_12195 [Phycisphaerae bacterium]|nr:hypothetical protein [Phycisphaerae bacterium]